MKFKKKNDEELELITGIENINPEALEELSNGLGEDDDIEACVALAKQHAEIVGASPENNKIFSPLCNVIIPSPNYNPRCDAAKYGVSNNKIDTITIHHMAGNLTVETCGNIFARTSRQASSNYGVGTDGRIAGYCGEENRSWCSSSKYNDFRAVTIEVANNTLAPNWTVSEAALTSTINLVVDICRRNGIKQLIFSDNKDVRVNHLNGANLTFHSDFGATACCGPYLKSIMADICITVTNILNGGPAPQPVNPYQKPTVPVNSGSTGESVKWIQWQLDSNGYALVIDGSYGPATTNAVKDFQSKHSLPVTGNCDMNTITVLDGGQPQPAVNPYPKPTTPVNKGAKGDNVKWIQWQLVTFAYGIAIDGSYGPATTNAVADFQQKHGLSVTGNCDMNTINVLDGGQPTPQPTTNPYKKPTSAVNSGSTGESVKWIQWQLNTYGYGLAVDGSYGPATTKAVKDFQSKHGLGVTGNCDMRTINALDGTAESFIDSIAAYVKKYAPRYNICVYSPVIAQAVLESAMGTSELATNCQNFFGLKYKGADRCKTALATPYKKEAIEQLPDGTYVKKECNWYMFPDMENGVVGYFDFINVARYSNLKGVTDPRTYLENIKSDGYATSIKYVDNLMAVIDKYNLTQYDPQNIVGATKDGNMKVKVVAQMLNVREGAGLRYPIKTSVKKSAECAISDVRNGWGKLANGSGWIDLKYTKKI